MRRFLLLPSVQVDWISIPLPKVYLLPSSPLPQHDPWKIGAFHHDAVFDSSHAHLTSQENLLDTFLSPLVVCASTLAIFATSAQVSRLFGAQSRVPASESLRASNSGCPLLGLPVTPEKLRTSPLRPSRPLHQTPSQQSTRTNVENAPLRRRL